MAACWVLVMCDPLIAGAAVTAALLLSGVRITQNIRWEKRQEATTSQQMLAGR